MRKLIGALLATAAAVAVVRWLRRGGRHVAPRRPQTSTGAQREHVGDATADRSLTGPVRADREHGPVPEQAGSSRRATTAYDPSVSLAEERHRADAARQVVIDQVLRSHGGGAAAQIAPVLRAALREHGLSAQPDAWLDAVASELSNGHVYLVSQAAADTRSTDHPDQG